MCADVLLWFSFVTCYSRSREHAGREISTALGALFQKDYLKGVENTMGRTVRNATERSGVRGNSEAK